MTALQYINWGIFGLTASAAVIWYVVCLALLPYPELVASTGGDLTTVFVRAAALTVQAVIAGIAAWLLTRRHMLQWVGQVVLILTLTGTLLFIWSQV